MSTKIVQQRCQDCEPKPEKLPAREPGDVAYYCESCGGFWQLGYQSETSGAWFYIRRPWEATK